MFISQLSGFDSTGGALPRPLHMQIRVRAHANRVEARSGAQRRPRASPAAATSSPSAASTSSSAMATPSSPRRRLARRTLTYMPRPEDGTSRTVTLIPGDGIGPPVTGVVCQVMEPMHAPVYLSGGREDERARLDVAMHGGGAHAPATRDVPEHGLRQPSRLDMQLWKELDLSTSPAHCANVSPEEFRNLTISSRVSLTYDLMFASLRRRACKLL